MDNKYNIYFFLIVFIIIFFGILFIYLRRLKKIINNKNRRNNKQYEIMEVNYLTIRKNLDKKKLLTKTHMVIIAILDALIISVVSTTINMINLHILWQLSIGFVMLFLLIYALYDIYGNILVHKGYTKKEEHKKAVKAVPVKKETKKTTTKKKETKTSETKKTKTVKKTEGKKETKDDKRKTSRK